MVSQLFDPTKPKVVMDLVVVAALASQVALMYLLPKSFRIPVFAVIFLFWRMCYNGGIGWLLHHQSNHRRLVKWARRSRIFDKPERDNQHPHPLLFRFLKRDMETMIQRDYKFEDAPIEYNTWLLFRRVVDLILMSDFTSYCLFAIANTHRPAGEAILITISRWVVGIVLILFNIWVKLDAHRVVKDYAWFWGDFFFLVDQELTFDGVFELAPHPMYSIGYIGFYGIALMAASYNVLFISLIAHAAQMIFLTVVENPHIDRTYNAPPAPVASEQAAVLDDPPELLKSAGGNVNDYPPLATSDRPSSVHDLLGIGNMDLLRVTDVAVVVLQIYLYAMALLTPPTRLWQTLFVLNAVAWRLWYSLGIGILLDLQASEKWWTRHFVKYGESTEEAWRQWKGLYHISLIMCTTSFICAAWKMYGLPADWTVSGALLRHVVGFALIGLQLWTSTSIYESLGEFGWFYGDFFFDRAAKLTYSGIYRYLNNPDRTIGLSGVWGVAIITWSQAIFFLALLSHALTLAFIQFVEKPHMQKLYRASGLRATSGVSKNLQRSLPDPLRRITGTVDKALDQTLDSLEDFVDAARPRLAAGLNSFVRDSSTLFAQFPARLTVTRLPPELAGYAIKDYSLTIDTSKPGIEHGDSASGEPDDDHTHHSNAAQVGRIAVEFGSPVHVRWTAPLNHHPRDWIGLYAVGDNPSRTVTRVRSQGRWVAVNPKAWSDDDDVASTVDASGAGALEIDQRVSGSTRRDGEPGDFLAGLVVFAGNKLPWRAGGTFELRYHHAGGYAVTAISRPFEIRIARFDETALAIPPSLPVSEADARLRAAVASALLPIVQNCFDRQPGLAPRTADAPFGAPAASAGVYAKRIVTAVQALFGIEFAPAVVLADGNVSKLAWRIVTAKRVLKPYSLAEEDEQHLEQPSPRKQQEQPVKEKEEAPTLAAAIASAAPTATTTTWQ